MMAPTSPELVAQSKRETMRSIKDQEFQQWRHHPVTAGFLQYLADMTDMYRNAAADLVEGRRLRTGDSHVDHNLDAMSGQIHMLRQVHGIELTTIQAFYQTEGPDADEG